jgi:hypothetical protein
METHRKRNPRMTELNEGKPALGAPNRMTPEIEQTLEELFCRFREKFGRDPGENDPIFFDPHSDQPVPMRQEALNEMWERLADAMVCQGEMTPETAYAMKKTGFLVTEQTKDLLRDAELDEWNKALAEYGSAGQNGLDKPMTPRNDLSSVQSVRSVSAQMTHGFTAEVSGLNCSTLDRSKPLHRWASRPGRKRS